FAMERIHVKFVHLQYSSHFCSRRNSNFMQKISLIVIDCIRQARVDVRNHPTAVQTTQHLHPITDAQYRLIPGKKSLHQGDFHFKTIRKWESRPIPFHVPGIGKFYSSTDADRKSVV